MNLLPDDIERYAVRFSSPEPGVLQRLSRETQAKVLRARMLSGHMQGRLLSFLSRLKKPKCILEIGTFTGYSAICLAEGLPDDGVLHTIDRNAELEDFAANFIQASGHARQIKQHIGEALDILPTIEGSFDLVFIDADKENYIRYFDLVYPKLPQGGVVIADNSLWSGKVLIPRAEMDDETRAISDFNTYINGHVGVSNLLLPFRDGLMLIEKL